MKTTENEMGDNFLDQDLSFAGACIAIFMLLVCLITLIILLVLVVV